MWCRLLLRDQLDSQVAGALADPRRATESARAVTLQRRTLVHVRLADAKLVGLGLFSLGLLGLLGCRLASALRLGLLLRLLGLALLRRRALGLGSRLLRRGLARALRLRLLLGGVVLLLLVVSH